MESCRLRAHRELAVAGLDSTVVTTFSSSGREDAAAVEVDVDDFRIYSKYPPANPLVKQAMRIAARPIRVSSLPVPCVIGVVALGPILSSCTMATPAARRKSANHLTTESDREKKRTEKRAEDSSLSW